MERENYQNSSDNNLENIATVGDSGMTSPVLESAENGSAGSGNYSDGLSETGSGNYTDGLSETGSGEKKKGFFWRASGKWTDFIIIASALSVLLTYAGVILSGILISLTPLNPWINSVTGDEDITQFLLQYLGFFGIWIVFILVISLFRDNWPMWKAFLYNGHGNNIRSIFAGILIGGGMNGLCILISFLMGDIVLSYNGFNPRLFFLFLLCVLIQSGAEEIVDRCYLYQKLRRRYRWPIIAIAVNSLMFMGLHLSNPGLTPWALLQIFEVGVLFSLFVFFFDSLWTAIWAHTAWNFSQSIVFGLPNSGIVSKYSVFKLDAASARDGLFYNTGFGVEGSIGACAAIGVAILIVLIIGLVRGKGERRDHWRRMEKEGKNANHSWEAVVLAIIIVVISVLSLPMVRTQIGNMLTEYSNAIKEQSAEAQQDTDSSVAEAAKTESKSDAKADKTESKSDTKSDKTESKSDAKAAKTESKSDAKDAKTESKSDAKDAKTESKSDAKAAKTESKSDAKAA